MLTAVAWSVAVVVCLLAALHLRWAAGPGAGGSSAVPARDDGTPLFSPGPLACAAVALLLSLAGVLAVGAEGSLDLGPFPQALVRAGAGVAGAVLLLRAVGDFNWVGFFKRRRSSRFAKLDTLYYSPLCLLLGLGLGACALWGRAQTLP